MVKDRQPVVPTPVLSCENNCVNHKPPIFCFVSRSSNLVHLVTRSDDLRFDAKVACRPVAAEVRYRVNVGVRFWRAGGQANHRVIAYRRRPVGFIVPDAIRFVSQPGMRFKIYVDRGNPGMERGVQLMDRGGSQ